VFDGHGGVSAGEYLCKELYSVLSDAIDEETYGEECSLEGAPARAPTAACVGPA
jgi:serine/threonine protein phosphatase PrpC